MTETTLFRLLAWLSPAFPTGAYAYSHGLEWAVNAGDVTDGTTARLWIADILMHGAGRNDAILLRHAHRAAHFLSSLLEINDIAAALAGCRERQAESLNLGVAFTRAVRVWGGPELPGEIVYPVAVGAAAGWHNIEEDATTVAYLQAIAANLISAAVRLVPLGQTTGLQILAALEPSILEVMHRSRTAALEDLGGCTFRSDLAAIRHETQYSRLFRS